MLSLRRVAIIGALITVPLSMATPAAATPPPGECPRPFIERNFDQQVSLVMEIFPGISREDAVEFAEAGDALYDRNDDDKLCFLLTGNPHGLHYNAIDNKVQGGTR